MEEILNLDRRISLFFNGSDSMIFDDVFYTATLTVTWIPVGLLLLYIVYRNGGVKMFWMVLMMILLGIFISDQLSSSIVKPLTHRFRPANDPEIMYLVDVVNDYRGGRYGFFSAHASNTFTVAVFLALLFRHRVVSIMLVSWAALNCYTRVYLGVHYMGDVLVGTCVGILVGSLLYLFYSHRHFSTVHFPAAVPVTPSGFRTKDMNLVADFILLNYCALFIVPFI